MESYENEQYISFPMTELQDVQDDSIISHEEICKQNSECIVSEMTETADSVQISDSQTASIHINEEDEKDHNSLYVKQENEQMTSGDDESMAVEALRQLGGMYPCFNDKKVTCSNCKVSMLSSELENHRTICKSTKFSCSICGECFDKRAEYNNHMVCHQVDRPHSCRTCGNLFRTKSNLQLHMSEAHQNVKVHKCNICGVDFQRPSSLSNHMKIHTYVAGRAIAQLQTEQKATDSQASTSVVASVQDYDSVQWSMPVYSFSSDQAIATLDDSEEKANTLQEFTVIPNGDVTQFEYTPQNVANFSNHQFVTISTFDNSNSDIRIGEIHYTENNTLKKVVVMEDGKKIISPIECEYCDKQFQDSTHLATHHKTCIKRIVQTGGAEHGSNWGKHACAECGKKFTTKQKMYRHQWIHRKKTHCCEVCGSQFERQVELDEHRLAAHPGDSPFTCTECGKSFVSRQGLWEHGRTHAGSPAHFHCDKCSKTFTSRQGYLIHHRTHTGERPYGCKFCWKAFRDGGTLRKHERIHTGERPHVCPLCSRAFNQKVVLREHVRWVHAAAKNDTEATGPPFPCPLCGDLNQDRDELCAHIVKHSDKMIAEAKAKTSNEPKKTSKLSKRKAKEVCKSTQDKSPKEVETLNINQEPIILTVAEPINKAISNHNVYLDSKQNTYILVNAGKTSKVHIVSDLKQSSDEVGTLKKKCKIKGSAIQICIENPDLGQDNKEDEGQRSNTLRLISKRNSGTPILTIPNLQTNDNFSSQAELVVEEEESEFMKQDKVEIMHVDGLVENVQYEQEDNEVSGIMEECRVCGEVGFKDKSELMEHVKIHI